MIKKTLFCAVCALLLAGCISVSEKDSDILSFRENTASAAQRNQKKPRIPGSDNFKASILDSKKEDMTLKLLEEIEQRIVQPNILYEDIKRGWYYGEAEGKKLGTPGTWTWVKDGARSRWISPNAMEETVVMQAEELCRKTAGQYVISCIEMEVKDCEYISRNTCRCIESSQWEDGQGCLLTNETGEFIAISQDELRRGWYQGLPNQKKLDTPANWVWADAGIDSRWQNPSPTD